MDMQTEAPAARVRFLDRRSPPHIATLILLTGVSALSQNMYLPSLPGMAEYFDTEYRVMQLSVALYLAMSGALQIVIGPLADRYGRRPVLLGAYLIFAAATVGCLLAPTAGGFLFFRMLQAVVVAGIVLGRTVVRDIFPEDRAASMIGYVTMGMALVPMLSPALGGVLDTAFGWQASFWTMLVCGLVVTWLAWRDMGETRPTAFTSFAQQVRDYPTLLTAPRFWGYSLTSAFGSGAFFAYLGGGPFVGSEIFHLDPAPLGLFFGLTSLGYVAGNFLTGRYAARVGVNAMVLTGAALMTGGMAMSLLIFYAGYGSAVSFFGFMGFVGLGNGMILPNATAGMLSVRPHLAGTASGLGGAMTIGGGAALSALAGSLLGGGGGAFPLLWIQFVTSVLSLVAILLVIRRERRLGLRQGPR